MIMTEESKINWCPDDEFINYLQRRNVIGGKQFPVELMRSGTTEGIVNYLRAFDEYYGEYQSYIAKEAQRDLRNSSLDSV
jgi:hypothetical protein